MLMAFKWRPGIFLLKRVRMGYYLPIDNMRVIVIRQSIVIPAKQNHQNYSDQNPQIYPMSLFPHDEAKVYPFLISDNNLKWVFSI